MNINNRLALQDGAIAALYKELTVDQRVETNEKVLRLYAETLDKDFADMLIETAKEQVMEGMYPAVKPE